MFHQIKPEKIGPRGDAMAEAVQTCVHCGFCLPTCPTYQVLGEEAESPRGRIILMKQVLEGKLEPEDVAPHLDRCLGCLACETSCPSGVPYSHLLSPYRDRMREQGKRKFSLRRFLALNTLPYRWRFGMAVRMGRIVKKWTWAIPKSLQPMLELLPENLPAKRPPMQEVYPATGTARGRVALLHGCAQSVLAPEINEAAIRVLNRNGIEVVVPKGQGCCGALAWHVGHGEIGIKQASALISVFPKNVDAIISTAAGCGSAMHEYPILLAGTAQEEEAKGFAKRCKDILTYLDEVGIEAPPALERPLRVAYHDACHLAHAQRQTAPPRKMLAQIPGLSLVSLADSDLCCGSAGTYNIDQPEIAAELGKRKAQTIQDSRCDLVALANIGCEVQIAKHLGLCGAPRPVLHVIQILDAAYRKVELA